MNPYGILIAIAVLLALTIGYGIAMAILDEIDEKNNRRLLDGKRK